MAAAKCQCDHDQLQAIAKIFSEQADNVDQILQNILGPYGELTGGGWIGVGERAWQKEQEDFTHKKMAKLSKALGSAGKFTSQISKTFQDAEDESGAKLKRM